MFHGFSLIFILAVMDKVHPCHILEVTLPNQLYSRLSMR